jgi:hypothetical protein
MPTRLSTRNKRKLGGSDGDSVQGNSSDSSSNSSTKRVTVSRKGGKSATDGVGGTRGDSDMTSIHRDGTVLDEGIKQEAAEESRSLTAAARTSSLDIGSVDQKIGNDGILIDVTSENKVNSGLTEGETNDGPLDNGYTNVYSSSKGTGATSSTTLLHPGCARFEPEQINRRVEGIVNSWEGVAPMQPDVFLYKLLSSRGYDSSVIPAREYRV